MPFELRGNMYSLDLVAAITTNPWPVVYVRLGAGMTEDESYWAYDQAYRAIKNDARKKAEEVGQTRTERLRATYLAATGDFKAEELAKLNTEFPLVTLPEPRTHLLHWAAHVRGGQFGPVLTAADIQWGTTDPPKTKPAAITQTEALAIMDAWRAEVARPVVLRTQG